MMLALVARMLRTTATAAISLISPSERHRNPCINSMFAESYIECHNYFVYDIVQPIQTPTLERAITPSDPVYVSARCIQAERATTQLDDE